MNVSRVIIVAIVILAALVTAANADPARFWISASNNPTIAPEASTINAPVGKQITLYIWAQPPTDNGIFRTLQDFSLDIVTQTAALGPESNPIVDFVDGSFKLYNDVVTGGKRRFQYVTDSLRTDDQGGPLLSDKTAAQVISGQPDAIRGLQGLSLDTNNVVGVGNINDRVMIGGTPAWRIGEFGIQAVRPTGTNTLFLQVGYAGMVSNGVGDTNVVFGNNANPIYDAANTSQRQLTLAGDTFDVQVNATSFTPGDYNGDGIVSSLDYIYWRSSFGQSVTPGTGADGNGNGVIDAGDYVFWRNQTLSASGSGAKSDLIATPVNSVPEPGEVLLASTLVVVAPLSRALWQKRSDRTA